MIIIDPLMRLLDIAISYHYFQIYFIHREQLHFQKLLKCVKKN